MSYLHAVPLRNAAALLLAAVALVGARAPGDPAAVSAKLSEWKVELSERTIAAGTVTFTVANVGSIPHAFEVEGQGIEQETAVIQPGSSATLTLTLKPGTYEVYCPVGEDSHKKLGMETDLKVVGAENSRSSGYGDSEMGGSNMSEMSESPARGEKAQAIRVTSGGPVIQILPGPFPFPDSAAPILKQFGDEREGLESQVKNGPYSNNVTPISGAFTFTAWDKGAVRDSVDGVAEFTRPLLPRQHGRAHTARTHDQQRGGAVGVRAPVQRRRPRDRQRHGTRHAVVPHPARRGLRARLLGLLQEQDRRVAAPNPTWTGRAEVRRTRRVPVRQLGKVQLREAGELRRMIQCAYAQQSSA